MKNLKSLFLIQGKDKKWTSFYPLGRSPFKTYKSALKYLKYKINRKTIYSNYKTTKLDWALFTLFNSRKFKEKLK